MLGRSPERSFAVVIALGIAVHVGSLGARWLQLGHGPFITLHESLSGGILGLMLLYGAVWLLVPAIRCATAFAFPVPAVMAAWLVTTDPSPGFLPPTYATPLLYLHVGVGKLFLATLLVALSLALAVLVRRVGAPLRGLPDETILEPLMRGFLGIAFLFDTGMLILGAIWAQDAWGRYWDWDPLETWSFLTWVLLGLSLHLRTVAPRQVALLSVCITVAFIVAFMTFFGIPFLSSGSHQGVT